VLGRFATIAGTTEHSRSLLPHGRQSRRSRCTEAAAFSWLAMGVHYRGHGERTCMKRRDSPRQSLGFPGALRRSQYIASLGAVLMPHSPVLRRDARLIHASGTRRIARSSSPSVRWRGLHASFVSGAILNAASGGDRDTVGRPLYAKLSWRLGVIIGYVRQAFAQRQADFSRNEPKRSRHPIIVSQNRRSGWLDLLSGNALGRSCRGLRSLLGG
jgi:hypothetical protein